MSTILQSVKKKIYAVCPEKMELSFGSQVKELNTDELFHYVGNGMWQAVRNYGVRKNAGEFQKGEILGHPLGLPEVLRAIEERFQRKINKAMGFNIDKEYDANQGDEYYHAVKTNVLELLSVWNLLVNLDGQSEETLTFLDGIL